MNVLLEFIRKRSENGEYAMAGSDPAGEWTKDFSEEEIAQEKVHVQRIINAFLSYRYLVFVIAC